MKTQTGVQGRGPAKAVNLSQRLGIWSICVLKVLAGQICMHMNAHARVCVCMCLLMDETQEHNKLQTLGWYTIYARSCDNLHGALVWV